MMIRPVRFGAVLSLCLALLMLTPAAGNCDDFEQWLKDGKLDVHFRSYYMNRHFDRTGTQEAMAVGGWVFYETAPLWGLSLGGALYTSQPFLFAEEDRSGTSLLNNDQEGYTVLGQAYLKAEYGGTMLKLFRQQIDTPFINSYDFRMTPVTYEAYTIENNSIDGLSLTASYVAEIKTWNDTVFQPMSQAAGAYNSDQGVTFVGAEYEFAKNYKVQAYNYFAHQLINIFYLQADGAWDLAPNWKLDASIQAFDQRDVGWALAGRYQTWQTGAQAVLHYKSIGLTLAYTQTGPDSAVFNPWSGYAGFTSIMEEDNDRADDKTWMVGLSCDFGSMGPGDLSAYTLFTSSDTPDTGQNASPDQWEADLTMDYKFKRGFMKGLWLRARGAVVNQDDVAGGQEYADFRFIINYEWNLLK